MIQASDAISRELSNFAFPIMKPYLIQILLLLMASTVFAELTATWTEVVIHTDQSGVEIVSSPDGEALSKLPLILHRSISPRARSIRRERIFSPSIRRPQCSYSLVSQAFILGMDSIVSRENRALTNMSLA